MLFITVIWSLSIYSTETIAQPPTPSNSIAVIESLLRTIQTQQKNQEALLTLLIDVIKQSTNTNMMTTSNLLQRIILTENLRNQQAKVENIAAELEQINTQISQISDTKIYDNQLREIEAAIGQSSDMIQRNTLIESYNSLKRSAEYEREQNQKTYEANTVRLQILQGKLAEEKVKLEEFENQTKSIDNQFHILDAKLPQRNVK